jgi:hypothetical protein
MTSMLRLQPGLLPLGRGLGTLGAWTCKPLATFAVSGDSLPS